jgi:hypothetical protein
VVVAFPVLTMFNYSPVAFLFGLAALLCLLRYLEAGRLADAIAMGALIACCTLTKQNFGALVLMGCTIGLFWGRQSSLLRERSVVAVATPIVVSGAGTALVAVLHFALLGTLGDWIQTTILDLGGSQLSNFNNPIPPIFGSHPADDGRFAFLYSPPTLFNSLMHNEAYLGLKLTPVIRSAAIRLSYGVPIALLIAGALLLVPRVQGPDSETRGRLHAIVPFALLFSFGIFPSAIWSHLAFVLPAILLLAAPLADRMDRVLEGGARTTFRMAVGAIVAWLLISALSLGTTIQSWYPEDLDLPRASLRVSPDQKDQFRQAVEFVENCSGPGDPIFVAPDMPVIYFLTDRLNPTPFDLTIPGNVDGELIRDRLVSESVRCIVFNPRMYPEFPAFEVLFPRLHLHLERHYKRTHRISGGWFGLTPKKAQRTDR